MGVEEDAAKMAIQKFKGTKTGAKVSKVINDPTVQKAAKEAVKLGKQIKKSGGVKKFAKSKEGKASI